MFPWIPFLTGGKKRLSDIEYLSIKEFDSKLVQADGTATATGDLASLTASSGKDMYLAKARINVGYTGATGLNEVGANIVLKVNGTVVETVNARFIRSSVEIDSVMTYNYDFSNIGQKVAATEIIKLEVISISSTSITVAGALVCFEETTGDSPAIS